MPPRQQPVTIDDARHRLLDDLFGSIDEKNTERFLRFLTDDAVFRFGSGPEVRGRDAIRDAVNEFFSTIDECRHVLHNILTDDGVLVCEGEVTYTRQDGCEITLPFANILEFAGEHISRYKIYADASPLYADQNVAR